MQRRDQIVVAILRLVVDRRTALDDASQALGIEDLVLRAARQTSSASVSTARPSPSAMRSRLILASGVSGSCLFFDRLRMRSSSARLWSSAT
jgi:hypothetical protein